MTMSCSGKRLIAAQRFRLSGSSNPFLYNTNAIQHRCPAAKHQPKGKCSLNGWEQLLDKRRKLPGHGQLRADAIFLGDHSLSFMYPVSLLWKRAHILQGCRHTALHRVQTVYVNSKGGNKARPLFSKVLSKSKPEAEAMADAGFCTPTDGIYCPGCAWHEGICRCQDVPAERQSGSCEMHCQMAQPQVLCRYMLQWRVRGPARGGRRQKAAGRMEDARQGQTYHCRRHVTIHCCMCL